MAPEPAALTDDQMAELMVPCKGMSAAGMTDDEMAELMGQGRRIERSEITNMASAENPLSLG